MDGSLGKYKFKLSRKAKQNLWGYLFILPIILGICFFILFPMIYSMVMSFFEWDFITKPNFIGLKNYITMFTIDDRFLQSMKVTGIYTLIYVPMMLVITMIMALLLNTDIKFMSFFRTTFYIPTIVPGISAAILWMFIYDPNNGVINNIFKVFGLGPYDLIYDKNTVLLCIAIMSVWAAGNTVIINLAGLKGISNELYESVDIDGGNAFTKVRHITIPMMTPIIFYNLIMAVIGSLQTFLQGYVITQGGPEDASLFYMLHLYNNAFTLNRMGYACAMSWVLFIATGILTAIIFKTSSWVYYEGGTK